MQLDLYFCRSIVKEVKLFYFGFDFESEIDFDSEFGFVFADYFDF